MKFCCVCQKPFKEGDATYTLGKSEKLALGKNAPDEIYYCQPCLQVIKDPVAGPEFLKGLQEMHLRELGVDRNTARKLSQKFYEGLLKLRKKNLS